MVRLPVPKHGYMRLLNNYQVKSQTPVRKQTNGLEEKKKKEKILRQVFPNREDPK